MLQASGILVTSLAVLAIGLQWTDALDVRKLREDDRWHHRRTSETGRHDAVRHSAASRLFDGKGDEPSDSHDFYEHLFSFPPVSRHTESQPPRRPSWDNEDDVNEPEEDDEYPVRKRIYIPASTGCDTSASRGHNAPAPVTSNSIGVPKLMRMPRIIRRRSVSDEANLQLDKDHHQNHLEVPHSTTDKTRVDGKLRDGVKDQATDNHKFPEDFDREGNDRDEEDLFNRVADLFSANDDHENIPQKTRGDQSEWPRVLSSRTNDRQRHLSLADLFKLHRKLRYEGNNLAFDNHDQDMERKYDDQTQAGSSSQTTLAY